MIWKVYMLKVSTGVSDFKKSAKPRRAERVPRDSGQVKVISYYFKVKIVTRKTF